MKLLLDVDAAVKLAHWGILQELPTLLNLQWDHCATLTSLRFRAQRSMEKPDGKLFHSAEAALVVVAICRELPVLPADTQLLGSLQDAPGVDAGEAVLLSALAASADARMLSGDKRCMRAVAELPAADRAGLAGKCIVVEQVILHALDVRGLQWLRERVCALRHIDKAIMIALGSRCDAPEASVREALRSYIREIEQACDPTLLAAL